MPRSIRKPIRASGGGLVLMPIRFYPDTANDPTTIEDPGNIVSAIAHTATGKYTITLNETPFDVVNVLCSMTVVGDSTDATAQGGVESGATVVVKTKAGATNTDFAADANTHVDVLLVVKELDIP